MNNGSNFKARPTMYRGVKMRSRLEAFTASWLDSMRLKWEYEPCCFADRTGQYLPDFLIREASVLGRSGPLYLEVKPAGQVSNRVGSLLRQMERIWATDATARLAIFSNDDAGFLQFPLRVPGPPPTTHPDALWIRCSCCGQVAIETRQRLEMPFGEVEPAECPACRAGPGFEQMVPWFSPLWYDLLGKR